MKDVLYESEIPQGEKNLYFSCCSLLLLIVTLEFKLVLVLAPFLSISTPVLQFTEQLKFCDEEPVEFELIEDVELSVELTEELVLL